jgi:anaerobic magnesium-protoporphyrin IX monomethyl ester cyclase
MANVLLISYDNGSHIPFFPQHLFYLAGALVNARHNVMFWLQDVHHGSAEELTRGLDNSKIDVVGLGFVAGYWQYAKAKEISKAVNGSKRRKDITYVLGGHGPAGEPDFFLRKMGADAVVIGDGETALCEIASSNKKGLVHGVPCTRDEAPIKIYEEFPLDIYRLIRWPTSSRTDFCFPILSSRGCKWHCSFCYRMREGFHERAIEAIIDEIKWLHDKAGINHFQFSDELLMSSEERTVEICESILRLPFSMKWDCNGRLNFALPEILTLMKRSGCEYVNYGIESLDQRILNQMKKGLTVEMIHRAIQDSLQCGVSPGLNLIWGFPGDTVENLNEAVDFLKKYDPCDELRTIRPVTPYPGCPLYQEAIDKGLLEGPEDFYERKHKNSDLFTVNFMDMDLKEAHRALWLANRELVKNYMEKRTKSMDDAATAMYCEGKSFRGFRAV